jgi:hypothetical protein
MYAEPELEEPMKQARAEDFTNIVWIKASPAASNPILDVLLNFV